MHKRLGCCLKQIFYCKKKQRRVKNKNIRRITIFNSIASSFALADDELCSDGEEFPEDDLLQELRARREHFQQRLEILDQLIALTSEV